MPATEARVAITIAMGSMAHTTHVPGTTTPHGVMELRTCRHALLVASVEVASAVAVVAEEVSAVVAVLAVVAAVADNAIVSFLFFVYL